MTPTDLHPTPADSAMLSVEAQAWLAQLPAPVRLHGVAAHAPDLANRIAAGWDDAHGTEALLEGLLVESVGTMPVLIAAELLRLYEYHAHCRATDAPSTAWELPALSLARARRSA